MAALMARASERADPRKAEAMGKRDADPILAKSFRA
jgi:hypothetical protein